MYAVCNAWENRIRFRPNLSWNTFVVRVSVGGRDQGKGRSSGEDWPQRC